MIKVMRFNSDERLLLMSVGIYLALSAGELRIVSSDPGVQPVLDYNYLSDPFDIERLRNGVRLAHSLAQHPEMAQIIHSPQEPTSEQLEVRRLPRRVDSPYSRHNAPHLLHLQNGSRIRPTRRS